MTSIYFVEMLSGNGDVHARHKFLELPIRIGRGYGNDVIVDDPHTAADHAIIEHDEHGNLIIRDLGSSNGIQHKKLKRTQFTIHGDSVFRLGHTQVRIRDNRYVVPAEINDATSHQWQGWPLLVFGIVIMCLITMTSEWIGDITEKKITDYIISAVTWLGISSVWAGAWTLANRVFGQTTHFSRHFFTFSIGMMLFTLINYVCVILAFGFSWEIFTGYGIHLQIIVGATTIYYHLHHINQRNKTRFKIICALFATVISSIILIKNHQNTNQYSDDLYMTDLLPPAMRFSRDHSVAEFNQAAQQLKAEINKDREKTLKEKSQKSKPDNKQ